MGRLTTWLDRRFYPEVQSNWDDDAFREAIRPHVDQSAQILDLGAGAGIIPQMNFKGIAGRVCGIDPDPRVLDNPYLDEGVVGVGENIPYSDASFDVVFADNVLEHLADPLTVFREVWRVLRPGGVFLAKTPNRLHYVPLAASLTPQSFHTWYNELRGRDAGDTFPTRYVANTVRTIRRVGRRAGFTEVDCRLIEGRPEYLRLSALTYALGIAYERAVNRIPLLHHFRVVIIAEARK